jgi:hypothetical protein
MLQLIEQSVVYGAKLVNRDTLRSAALARNVQIWVDQLQQGYSEQYKKLASKAAAAAGGGGAAEAVVKEEEEEEPLLRRAGRAEEGRGAAAAAAEGGALIEGWLFKRKARDTFGFWRCCGESWTRRWFSLRHNVLYYYRCATAARPLPARRPPSAAGRRRGLRAAAARSAGELPRLDAASRLGACQPE